MNGFAVKVGNEYVKSGPEPRYTMHDVYRLREYLQEGDMVLAEVFAARSRSSGDGGEVVLFVTILAKYPHVAVTDRGTVSWVNILLHNADILRKLKA